MNATKVGLVFAINLLLILIAIGTANAEEFNIGYIPTSILPPGCGMQFWDAKINKPNGKILIDKDLKSTWLKIVINDKVQIFSNTKKVANVQENHKYTVGDSFEEEYTFGGISIILRYRITNVCPASNPDCESTDYFGEMIIKSKQGKQIRLNLKGNGGC